MAAAKKLLVLDLGMQSMRLAEFVSSTDGALQLLRAAKRDFLLDPSMETTRPDQIRLALEEILKEWKLKSGQVSLILPAHTVFTKVAPVEVPGGNIEQIGAVVAFEAQAWQDDRSKPIASAFGHFMLRRTADAEEE